MKIHITKVLSWRFHYLQENYEKEKGWWEYYDGQLHIFVYPFTSLKVLVKYILYEVTESILEHYLRLPHSIAYKIAKAVEKLSILLPNIKVMPMYAFQEFLEDNNIEGILFGSSVDFYYKGSSIYVVLEKDLNSIIKRYRIYEEITRRIEKRKEKEIMEYL